MWKGDYPIATTVPTQTNIVHKSEEYIHSLSGIQTHNRGVWAVQDHSNASLIIFFL
jgi:hypothetical protein